ncbi:MAG: L,D-transpeptidase [Pseudomonadota bacterium]
MQRRSFLAGSAALMSAGASIPVLAQDYDSLITPSGLAEEMQPREIRIRNDFEPGEIHVDPAAFALYWTLPKKKAIRYSVGIGRKGLYESGTFTVGAKKKWPGWRPTDAMIERNPQAYAQFADGMPGGPDNPLGARALYLFVPGRGDTFLRIHGTNAPKTIGYRVSNGCARLANDHVLDLYERVPLGTKVVLYSAEPGDAYTG